MVYIGVKQKSRNMGIIKYQGYLNENILNDQTFPDMKEKWGAKYEIKTTLEGK